MSKFTDGLKKGLGRAAGFVAAGAIIGFCVAGPPGAVAGMKAAVGLSAAGS